MDFEQKVFSGKTESELKDWVATLPRPLVFTNGCFDILHLGHVKYLQSAKALGAALVVGINSDESVKRLDKAPDRPFNCLDDRLAVIAALQSVSGAVAFSQDTPLELVHLIRPDIIVKGGDWAVEDIVGGKEVQSWGGSVHSIKFEHSRSTTSLVEQIKRSNNG